MKHYIYIDNITGEQMVIETTLTTKEVYNFIITVMDAPRLIAIV